MPCIHEYLSARGHKFNDLIKQFVQVLTIKHLPRKNQGRHIRIKQSKKTNKKELIKKT